jgi:hypothetical protein
MRRTSALVSTCCFAIAAASSVAGIDRAWCDEAKPSLAVHAENRAREMRWFWYDEQAELTHCLKESERIKWRVEHTPRRSLSVEIPTKDGTTYSFDAHWNTVFCHDEARLYYVRFSPIGPGGNVIAVNLATGKEEWRCEVGRIVHEVSFVSYSSKRLIFVRDGMVFVVGNESGGRFLNIIDASTGKLLAERRFE